MGLIVGMQDRVDAFMRPFTYEDGRWHFKTRDMRVPLEVTEEQVNGAEAIFRRRFIIASCLSWALVLGAAAWVYHQILGIGGSYWNLLAILPAWYLSFLCYLWANRSATRSLRSKLLNLNIREVRKRKGRKPAWATLPPRDVIVRQLAFCCGAFAISLGMTAWGYRNNIRALRGVEVMATVIAPPSHQQCQVEYAYSWRGQRFEDGLVSCRILEQHPVGAKLLVRVDPSRPGHSVLPNQSPWPAVTVVPVMMGPLLLVALVAL